MSAIERLGATDETSPAVNGATEPFALEVVGVSVAYGPTVVVDDVSLAVGAGELVGLIGPNGAGKTTLFEAISGFVPVTSGEVRFGGDDVTTWAAHRKARAGLARSFQDASLFGALTSLEVVQVALERHVAAATDALGDLVRSSSARRAERWSRERAEAALERFGLTAFRSTSVAELSTGTRRILELAAVLALEPAVLLLDEPTAGIAQRETEALAELIADIRRSSPLTILLIEHDVPMVMALADRVYVLDAGRLIASGPPASVTQDDAVIEAYLGVGFTEREDART